MFAVSWPLWAEVPLYTLAIAPLCYACLQCIVVLADPEIGKIMIFFAGNDRQRARELFYWMTGSLLGSLLAVLFTVIVGSSDSEALNLIVLSLASNALGAFGAMFAYTA